MAPNNEVGGLRTALAMGAAKAVLVSDDALAGSDALGTAKVLAAAIERAASADLVLGGHRVVRRLHRHRAGADRRAARPAVGHLRQGGRPSTARTVKVQRQTEAGYDEVERPLPAVVSVTAGVVEPRYPSFKGIMAAKSKPVDSVTVADLGIDASSVGWAGAGQEIVDVAERRAREAGEIIEDDGEAFEKIVAFLDEPQGHLSRAPERENDMALSKIWVFAEATDGKVAPITLEMLTKARALADTVEAVYVGGDADAIAADARCPRRHQGPRHRRPRRQAPRRRRRRGGRRCHRRPATAPT